MPEGLSLPIAVTKAGKAVVSKGKAQLEKIIRTVILPSTDRNAFQNIGITESEIFGLDVASVYRSMERKVKDKFEELRFQLRAELASDGVTFDKTAEGETDIHIKYIDLETDKEDEIIITI